MLSTCSSSYIKSGVSGHLLFKNHMNSNLNSFISLAFLALLSLSKLNEAADALSTDNLPQGGSRLNREESDFYYGFERFDEFLESPRDSDSIKSDNDTLNKTTEISDDTKVAGDTNDIDMYSDSYYGIV